MTKVLLDLDPGPTRERRAVGFGHTLIDQRGNLR